MAEKNGKPQTEEGLRGSLEEAYKSRALLFRAELEKRGLNTLVAVVRDLDASGLSWDDPVLGISTAARAKVLDARVPLHWVFCHPEILSGCPNAIEYYRLLAALPAKGLGQVVKGFRGQHRIAAKIRAVNTHISAILDESRGFSLDGMRDLMFAEVGSEIQGTWVNLVGQGAAQHLREILEEVARQRGLVDRVETAKTAQGDKTVALRTIHLRKGWSIVFGSEPDVSIFDPQGVIQCAMEIKGSMDVSGAQTRYGEAKKSFAKALKVNPRCETIYLFSCMTPSVQQQIRDDGEVRKTYNLTDIFVNEAERDRFLDEVFHHIIRVE
jgi:hypothetical protein